MRENLYIFTASYPYGLTETFLHNEIIGISAYFNKITLLPLYNPTGDDTVRELPDNVRFEPPILPHHAVRRSIKGLFNFAPIVPYFRDLVLLFSNGKKWRYNIKQWYLSLLTFRCCYSSTRFKNLMDSIEETDILYFYWGQGQATMLPFLTHKRTFVRIHGGEIDLGRHFGYIPMLSLLVRNTPNFIAISELVKKKLEKGFGHKHVLLNRLGVFDMGFSPQPSEKDSIRIVTCSNLVPLKRVHLIIEALSMIQHEKVEWIHFGDGPQMDELIALCKIKLDQNIHYQFKGRVSNQLILDYYKNNYVDLFVNVSSTEGIPVSIMEAISFGIPCFATDVGAVRELVNGENGMLAPSDFEPGELADFIREVRARYDLEKRKQIKQIGLSKFNAVKNHYELATILK